MIGAACHAPEPFSDRMWNLYFISVTPARPHGVGQHADAIARSSLWFLAARAAV